MTIVTSLYSNEFFAAHALKGMTVEGAEQDILQEIRKGVHDGKGEDMVVLVMKEFDEAKGKMLRSSEWSKVDGLWQFCYCIYVPLIADLHHWVTEQHHDSCIMGHAG
jgi:hypothetical protein